MKTTLETLRDARDKVAQGWTRNSAARDIDGFAIGTKESGAAQWCAIGAICAVTDWLMESEPAIAALKKVIPCTNLASWNDDRNRTQVQVVHAFNKAIGLALGETA